MTVPTFVTRAVKRLGRRGARLQHDERAATAVEFGLLALPFVALSLAILETALLYFAGQSLETAVANSGRLIRTGQAQQQGMSATAFKQTICDQVGVMFDCSNGLKLDVRTFATFDSINLTPPVDQNGNMTNNFNYLPGKGGDIVVVRAYYEWPTFSKLLGLNFSNLADGNHLLAATAAFKNEPFPW